MWDMKQTDRKIQGRTEIHVIPLQDDREHVLEKTCWCCPTPDDEYPMIFTHNSSDGRESYERGIRKFH